jgi:hypothetical protein
MFNCKNLKIMNLENLNLVELNAKETVEIEGGILPVICIWAVCKGIGIGVYGTYKLGHSIGKK